MRLEGSCYCKSVRFLLESRHPYPFNVCYCSICRKTAGSGGSAINLGGDFTTLDVEGEDFITIYQARSPVATAATRKARRGAISVRSAAARFGFGTRVGRNWFTRTLRQSTQICPCHRKGYT